MEKKEIILYSKHQQRPFAVDMRYREKSHAQPVIIFVHGFKGFKDWGTFNLVADFFAEKGYVFVKLNFSHNGTTPQAPVDFVDLEAFGQNNFSIELDDLAVLIDYLHEHEAEYPELDLSRIALIGHSRGGAISILKASEDKRIKVLATWAALSDLKNLFPENQLQEWKEKGVFYSYNSRTKQQMPLYYQIYEDYLAHPDRLDVQTATRNLHQPMIAFHGSKDQSVKLAAAYQLKEWNPDIELVIIENADHTFGGSHPYSATQLPPDLKKVVEKTHVFFENNL